MHYREHAPHSGLKKYIKCFWELSHTPEGTAISEFAVLAEGAELLFLLSGTVQSVDSGVAPEAVPVGALFGPMSRPKQVQLSGCVSVLGVCFQPGGASPFLSGPVKALQNHWAAMDDLWGADASRVAEQVREGRGSIRACIDRLNRFFLHRLRGPHELSFDLSKIVEAMARCNGRVRVDRLAAEAGVSPRGMERLFEAHVGLTPKQYCRSLRFKQAFRCLIASKAPSGADLAAACGYYDQSHLIREFRFYTGKSPSAFLGAAEREAAFFSGN